MKESLVEDVEEKGRKRQVKRGREERVEGRAFHLISSINQSPRRPLLEEPVTFKGLIPFATSNLYNELK